MGRPPQPRHEVVQPSDQSLRLIPLTRGLNAIVDATDYDWLMQWNWCSFFSGSVWYCQRRENGRVIYMHQQITGFRQTDHRNGNGLDNRRCNLRKCSFANNAANVRKQANTSSRYKGVSWMKKRCKWTAYINFEHRRIQLGSFTDEVEAAMAYDVAASHYFGEFACLNFGISRRVSQ